MGTIKYSGPVASFHCPTNAEIRSLKVHFSPKQEGSGDPSPENVRPIVGWDGVEVYRNDSTINYEFGVLGKNKFNWNVPVSESSPVGSAAATAREFTLDTYVIGMSVNNYYRQNYANWVLNPSVENGVISFSSGSASGYGIAFPLKLAAGQTYFLSGTGDGAVGATYYNEDGELISYQNGRLNKTITVPENTAITLIGFYANTSNTEFTFSDIQLELGSTATAYEPYDPNKTVYGGWVDLISGEVQQEWGLRILNGSEVWSTQNPHANYNRIFLTSFASDGIQSLNILVNWIRPISTGNDPGMYIDGNLCCRLGWADKQFYILNAVEYLDEVVDIASFKEYLSNHNLQVVYPLAAPITYQLAPTSMQTFLSANNVWTNADYVEVEYDLHETQTLLQRKAFIMANQPHIESASGAIASFKTDLRAPLKECKAYFSPVQDLHGYSNPWPAGGGRNLFHVTAQSKTSDSGVVFTVNSDGSVKAVGNPSTSTALDLGTITLTEGTYKIQGGVSNTAYINIPSKVNSYGGVTTFTIATGGETITPRIYLTGGYEVNGTFYPMIKLNSDNDATWAPYENICPIEGWTGCNIFKAGKNLLNPTKKYQASNTQVCIGQNTGRSHYEIFLKAGTYIITTTTTIAASVYIARTSLSTTSVIIGSTNKSLTFELDTDDWCEFFIYKSSTGITTDQVTSFQLEVGSVASNDSTYSGITIPLSWQSTAGTIYGGYVDLVKGELVQTHYKITVDGVSTNCKINSDYSNDTYIIGGIVYLNPAGEEDNRRAVNTKLLCDKVPILGQYDTVQSIPAVRTISAGSQYLRFYLAYTADHPELDTAQKRKDFCNAWFAENNVDVVYPLKTPITYTLTPTQLKSLVGANNIWANNGGGNIEVSFWRH